MKSDASRRRPLLVNEQTPAGEEIRTLDVLLGKKVLYH